jgi:hypothetical protein
VDEARLRAVGHGKSQLKVPTSDPEPLNRRVEFIVSRAAPPTKPTKRAPKAAPGPRPAAGAAPIKDSLKIAPEQGRRP